MTQPWIIWTTPRTGGTSLYEALWKASPDLTYIDDEPFMSVWRRDWSKYPSELERLFSGARFAIKHVLDPFSDGFNIALAQATSRTGYTHIHLVRRNELAWLTSRGVALQLDAWNPRYSLPLIDDVLAGRRVLAPLNVPALIAYSRKVRRQWGVVADHLFGGVHTVAYEDIYGENNVSYVADLSAFLGLRVNFSERLKTGSQDTSRIWHLIPNLNELRAALANQSGN